MFARASAALPAFAIAVVVATFADAASLPITHRYCGKDLGIDANALSYPAENSTCPYSTVEKTGKNAWRVNVTCGDGSTFSAAIEVSASGRTAKLTNADSSSQALTRCD